MTARLGLFCGQDAGPAGLGTEVPEGVPSHGAQGCPASGPLLPRALPPRRSSSAPYPPFFILHVNLAREGAESTIYADV